MSTRRAKQLIYGTLYILIVVLVFAGIYFAFVNPVIVASAPPRCTPSTCAPTSTAAITAGAVQAFVTSPGHYTFLAHAADMSGDYGAQVLNYEIDLDDASGAVLQSIPGESFIYPSQTKYLAALNVPVAAPFDHASLVIDDASWLASFSLGAATGIAAGQFAVQNMQASAASTTVSVSGQLINSSVASYGQAIVMVIFGTLQNPTGVSQTEIENVGAGSTNNFSVIYPALPNIDPAANQVIVYALR